MRNPIIRRVIALSRLQESLHGTPGEILLVFRNMQEAADDVGQALSL